MGGVYAYYIIKWKSPFADFSKASHLMFFNIVHAINMRKTWDGLNVDITPQSLHFYTSTLSSKKLITIIIIYSTRPSFEA